MCFFESIDKFIHYFFLDSVYTKPVSAENLVLEILAEMVLTKRIAGFLNQLQL